MNSKNWFFLQKKFRNFKKIDFFLQKNFRKLKNDFFCRDNLPELKISYDIALMDPKSQFYNAKEIEKLYKMGTKCVQATYISIFLTEEKFNAAQLFVPEYKIFCDDSEKKRNSAKKSWIFFLYVCIFFLIGGGGGRRG